MMRAGEDEVSVLRSKYHDWCSARVADRFVELSPEQIYELAHAGGGDAPEGRMRGSAEASASIDAGAFSFEDADYTDLVRRVTEVLATSMELPAFEAWAESYRRDPARYDREMLGFWRGA
jgi:hypothetical protein